MTATMSWELDREREEFRASVPAFVDRQVRPALEESEEAGRPPAALLKEMSGAGLLGLAPRTASAPRRRLLRDVVEYGGPQGDTSAMEDLAGLQAVQQAVAAEAAPTA
jgi:alkylation response protein AidB-like acyl-CoA dehydrogenase